MTFEERLAQAVGLREGDRDEEARALLVQLHAERPDDAAVNLQCAWVHDKLGLEREAIGYYEAALRHGLDDEPLHDALLGLGSTYRALGDYDAALDTLTRGVNEFPADNGLRIFHAMALYNTGHAKKACETLLTVITETSKDHAVIRYRAAISEYAADLDRTWS
ncbi:MAG: tetratricopeptide repeat protein [Acidimicrobiia bacterium]